MSLEVGVLYRFIRKDRVLIVHEFRTGNDVLERGNTIIGRVRVVLECLLQALTLHGRQENSNGLRSRQYLVLPVAGYDRVLFT